MADQLVVAWPARSGDVYCHIMQADGQYLNGSTPEAYNEVNWQAYAVALTQDGTSAVFRVAFPVGITTPGVYFVIFYESNAGAGNEAVSDTFIASTSVEWSGTNILNPIPVSSGVTLTINDTRVA